MVLSILFLFFLESSKCFWQYSIDLSHGLIAQELFILLSQGGGSLSHPNNLGLFGVLRWPLLTLALPGMVSIPFFQCFSEVSIPGSAQKSLWKWHLRTRFSGECGGWIWWSWRAFPTLWCCRQRKNPCLMPWSNPKSRQCQHLVEFKVTSLAFSHCDDFLFFI